MDKEYRIQTTVVGSYPVPDWLSVLPSQQTLRDAIMVILKTQEIAGIDVVADGELSRFDINHPDTNGMIDYFVAPLEGIGTDVTRKELDLFRSLPGMGFRAKPAGVVREDLDEGSLSLVADYDFVRDLTSKPLKFTVTSPYMLAKTLLDTFYGDREALLMALAEVLRRQVAEIDAAVVQVDEANLPGTPDDASLAARAINHVLQDVTTERAVHLCFGNYGGQTIQKGGMYRKFMNFFDELEVDHLVLEFARRGYDELNFFKDMKPSITLGLGVIDIKDNEVESPDEIARRIELAVEVLGAERVKWVHPDCGFWMLKRSVADRKMAALVAGRNLFEGK
jgi:5-methyltetrahydropteroyltriglutamate--homocysteine methyltransferase